MKICIMKNYFEIILIYLYFISRKAHEPSLRLFTMFPYLKPPPPPTTSPHPLSATKRVLAIVDFTSSNPEYMQQSVRLLGKLDPDVYIFVSAAAVYDVAKDFRKVASTSPFISSPPLLGGEDIMLIEYPH